MSSRRGLWARSVDRLQMLTRTLLSCMRQVGGKSPRVCRPLGVNLLSLHLFKPRNCGIPRLHDDGAVRNDSAWHGTERLSSNVYTRLWLCGIEWFLKSNSVINYNHCQKSKWMPCLQRSVQSRKGGIKCTKEGERLYFLVFLVTYTILWQWPSNTPQMASIPILLYTN